MEEFSKELKATSKQQLGRKKARLGLPRTRKKLDATLQGMIGEANVKFAKGDFILIPTYLLQNIVVDHRRGTIQHFKKFTFKS